MLIVAFMIEKIINARYMMLDPVYAEVLNAIK